jgi:hypothetical protein
MRKHVPTNAHPRIEGRPVLGNRPVNTYHSNEYRTVGRPLLGNAWVDTPDNNTWHPLPSSWCVFCGWSEPSLYRKQWRLFDRIRQEDVIESSSAVELRGVQGNWETNDFYTVQEKIIRVTKIADWQTESNSRVPEATRLELKCEDFTLCVIVSVIIWNIIILCSYN